MRNFRVHRQDAEHASDIPPKLRHMSPLRNHYVTPSDQMHGVKIIFFPINIPPYMLLKSHPWNLYLSFLPPIAHFP